VVWGGRRDGHSADGILHLNCANRRSALRLMMLVTVLSGIVALLILHFLFPFRASRGPPASSLWRIILPGAIVAIVLHVPDDRFVI
jgi:O-antigen/teichoic acid export membrane protein